VTVTRLPVTRCEVCGRTLAHRPGQASAVLTEHYHRMHPDALTDAADAAELRGIAAGARQRYAAGTCAPADVTMTTGTAALIAWLITAGIGVYMLRTWIARGGLRRQRATGVGVPPGMVFGHASAALTGLAAWVGFLASGWDTLAWVGVVLICTAVTLGVCTVTLWTPYPVKADPAADGDTALAAASQSDWPHWGPTRAVQPGITPGPAAAEGIQASPAEHPDAFTVTDDMIARLLAEPPAVRPRRRIPLLPLIPACHGLAAMTTFLLALLAALNAR
jgi:hypothetical protein